MLGDRRRKLPGRVDWIGNAVAEAFEIDRSDVNWKKTVKRIIKSLERQNILTPSEALTDRRKSVPTLVFTRRRTLRTFQNDCASAPVAPVPLGTGQLERRKRGEKI